MSEQPTPETDAESIAYYGVNHPDHHHGFVKFARSLEQRLLTAQSSNQKLTEDLERERQGSDSIKEQVDGLRAELETWKEKFFIAESQVENADVNLEQVRMAMKSNHARERDALAAQVATLTAERNNVSQDADQYFEDNKRLIAENTALKTDLKATEQSNDNLSSAASLYRNDRDQLRTQNAELMADCVVLRGVLAHISEADSTSLGAGLWVREMANKALATTSPGAPLIEAVRRAVQALDAARKMKPGYTRQCGDALAELEKFLPKGN